MKVRLRGTDLIGWRLERDGATEAQYPGHVYWRVAWSRSVVTTQHETSLEAV